MRPCSLADGLHKAVGLRLVICRSTQENKISRTVENEDASEVFTFSKEIFHPRGDLKKDGFLIAGVAGADVKLKGEPHGDFVVKHSSLHFRVSFFSALE